MSLEDEERRTASLRAVAHPVRLQILSLLTGAEMSAAEIARELGITQANASYHVRRLVDTGHLLETGRVKVRGGMAKKFRYVAEEVPAAKRDRAGGSRRSLTAGEVEIMVGAYSQELRRRMMARKLNGRASHADAEMWVSPETWAQVRQLVNEASHLLHAEARPPRSEGTIKVNMQTHLFEMEEDPR